MTAQISDCYKIGDKDYSLIALNNKLKFNPRAYGLDPVGYTTACYRGFYCMYKVSENKLILDELNVYCGDGFNYPEVNGVLPKKEEGECFSEFRTYPNLNLKIDYTGSIVVGTGFLGKYYIHMGYQRAWAYKTVYELQFDKGNLVKKVDHSKYVKKLRDYLDKNIQARRDLWDCSMDFINECFSLDARDKAWWI